MAAKNFNNNGFEYVDLDLPSGTLWATCNVGASNPKESGLFFQWGDTKGYAKDQVGKDKQFNWNDYKFSIKESNAKFSKYKTLGIKLDLEDDAAHVNMGGDWHIPTLSQIWELRSCTTTTWTTQDDMLGILLISNINKSKSIFFPSAGFACDGLFYGIGSVGRIWSSELYISIERSYSIWFELYGSFSLGNFARSNGLSVRGVIG